MAIFVRNSSSDVGRRSPYRVHDDLLQAVDFSCAFVHFPNSFLILARVDPGMKICGVGPESEYDHQTLTIIPAPSEETL